MADPAIWWTPIGSDTVRKVSIPRRLARLTSRVVRHAEIIEGPAGHTRERHLSARHRVEMRLGPFNEPSVRAVLEGVESHLNRGGLISLAADSDRAWAGFCTDPPVAGETDLVTGGNMWDELGGSSPNGGHFVVLQSGSPQVVTEQLQTAFFVASLGKTVKVLGGVANDWSDLDYCLVRDLQFFPVLRRAKEDRNSRALTNEREIHYTLDLVLDEAIDVLAALAATPETTLKGSTSSGRLSVREVQAGSDYEKSKRDPSGTIF